MYTPTAGHLQVQAKVALDSTSCSLSNRPDPPGRDACDAQMAMCAHSLMSWMVPLSCPSDAVTWES